jgi:NAD(P)-dependent dehydrogenase (short-subunit alcohol dehydrogenase family)
METTPARGYHTTTDEVLEGVSLPGKRVLVTGASTGLGLETAKAVATHGGNVVLAVRDTAKTERNFVPIYEAAAQSGARVSVCQIELDTLASVRAAADGLLAEAEPVNVVVANAGVFAMPGKTVDGFEMHFGTNHLGHFVLINCLMPLIMAGAPGGRDAYLHQVAERLAPMGGFKSVAAGAATIVWAAFVAPSELVGGRYCEDCAVSEANNSDDIGGVKSYALDPERAEALWTKSEEFVGETFNP